MVPSISRCVVNNIRAPVSLKALPQEWIVHVQEDLYGNGEDWTAPYDFEMTVFTTVGSLTVSLDAPTYDHSARGAAELQLAVDTEVQCTTYAPQDLDNLYGVDTPEKSKLLPLISKR